MELELESDKSSKLEYFSICGNFEGVSYKCLLCVIYRHLVRFEHDCGANKRTAYEENNLKMKKKIFFTGLTFLHNIVHIMLVYVFS